MPTHTALLTPLLNRSRIQLQAASLCLPVLIERLRGWRMSDRVGQQFGNYRLLRLLGRGKRQWVRVLAAGILVVVVSSSLVGLGLLGKGPLAGLGAKATSTARPTATPLPTVTITEFPLPAPGDPDGVTVGPDGNIWFTEPDILGDVTGGNQIGCLTPTGKNTEFPVPTPDGSPSGITVGPDGNLWFTEYDGNRIGRITPTGKITEFPLSTSGNSPYEITAGPDGNLWFTESSGNQIGRITPAGKITEFPLPEGSNPRGITAGPDGNLWFTESDKIGRITSDGQIIMFSVPTPGRFPWEITAGPDGSLWFTEIFADKIGRITSGA